MNQFLSDVERMLSSRRAARAALERVARIMVPRLGDFCFIFLARGREIRCVATAHSTGEGLKIARRLAQIYRIRRDDPISTVAHVVRTGRPKLHATIRNEAAAAPTDAGVSALHQALGARCALVLPLVAPSDVLGAISLSYAASGRRYAAHNLALAERCADMIAAFVRDRTSSKMPPAGAPDEPPLLQRRQLRLRARA